MTDQTEILELEVPDEIYKQAMAYAQAALAADEGAEPAPAPPTRFPVVVKSQAFDRDNNSYDIQAMQIPQEGVPLLVNHDRHGMPVGWVDEFEKTSRYNTPILKAQLAFDEGDAEAMVYAGKVARRMYRWVSGGWNNITSEPIDDVDDPANYYEGIMIPWLYKGRSKITKSELMEVSLVNTPADPRAKITASVQDRAADAAMVIRAMRAGFGLPQA